MTFSDSEIMPTSAAMRPWRLYCYGFFMLKVEGITTSFNKILVFNSTLLPILAAMYTSRLTSLISATSRGMTEH
jgi:hypothetical protein